MYPITPVKGTASLNGSVQDFTPFWKTKSSKRAHAPFFVALILRYMTDTFQRKEKLHIDLKKQKKDKN